MYARASLAAECFQESFSRDGLRRDIRMNIHAGAKVTGLRVREIERVACVFAPSRSCVFFFAEGVCGEAARAQGFCEGCADFRVIRVRFLEREKVEE